MKRIFLGFLAVAAISALVLTGCETITPVAPGAPTNLRAEGYGDGTQLKLMWDPPATETTPDGYIIYFEGSVLDTVRGSTEYIYSPGGVTGLYQVTAYTEDGGESDPASLSTDPVVTQVQIVLAELNAAGNSGLGFTPSWTATSYPMADPAAPDNVDFYFTDGSPGYTGLFQYIASPDKVVDQTFENGRPASVPTTGWRSNRIKENAVNNGIVQSFTDDYDFATSNSTYGFAIQRNGDWYYGYLELGSVTQEQATVVKVVIQTIPNFRVVGQE